MALLCLPDVTQRPQVRRGIGPPRPGSANRETCVRCDATKSVIPTRHRPEGLGALSHVGVSGRTVGSQPTVGEPCRSRVGARRDRTGQISAEKIEIRMGDAVTMNGQDRALTLPWILPPPYQRREIIQGEGEPRSTIRPMRVRARAVFAESLRNAHRRLDELIKDPHQTIEAIAAREHKSERSIRMTLSLAFVAPPIVAAAIEGRLSRGFRPKLRIDLAILWSHQWTALGLKVPT